MNATTIQRDFALHPDDQQHDMLQTWEDGVTVSDLTLDCAGSDALQYINGGIYLMGSACTVSNVKVIRCSGNATNLQESTGIAVGDGSRYTSNNLVVSCVVTQVSGTYQGGISIGGYYTQATSNIVYMPAIEDRCRDVLLLRSLWNKRMCRPGQLRVRRLRKRVDRHRLRDELGHCG